MTKIELLKSFAKGWFGNSQQHSIHAQLLKARGLNKLADKIMAESDEEWEEAKKVNARLIDLGETPVVEIEAYPVITDIKEMLEYDCKDSAEALPMMSKSVRSGNAGTMCGSMAAWIWDAVRSSVLTRSFSAVACVRCSV